MFPPQSVVPVGIAELSGQVTKVVTPAPASTEVMVLLVLEDLKARKVTHVFDALGFNEGYYNINLCYPVLMLAGFTERSDALAIWYYHLIERYSAALPTDPKAMFDAAIAAYAELLLKAQGKL